MLSTTVGQAYINSLLPPELRNYRRILDKKGVSDLLGEVAKQHPDKYREISFALGQIGKDVSTATGGNSFDITDVMKLDSARKRRQEWQAKIDALLDDDSLDDKQRESQIISMLQTAQKDDRAATFDEAFKAGNPLAIQVLGAGRGNPGTVASMLASDLLYEDSQGRTLGIPIMKSYSEGLSPAEYLAACFGGRQGIIGTKLAVADAGYFSKLLQQASHRLIVTDVDRDGEPDTLTGLPASTTDMDNEGALLAKDAGTYKRNTVLTPKILRDLQAQGIERMLVRSPIASGSPDGGVYARDLGIREFNRLPNVGEIAGLVAGQAVGEPVSQGSLGSKHGGGVAGGTQAVTGFAALQQLITSPEQFKGGAVHSELDGTVTNIAPAPAGGHNVFIGSEMHHVPHGVPLKVKRGDQVEAGDVLSEGIPVPHKLVQHKGHGEARRYFTDSFMQAMRGTGTTANSRNVALLSRALINHVRFRDSYRDYAPEDVVPYSLIEHDYVPRDDAEDRAPEQAKGMYLEKPYLHYTIGTPVRPSVIKTLREFGVEKVKAHAAPPPWQPEFVPAPQNLSYDPDPLTRMYGSGLRKGLLDATHRGLSSDAEGTSFVPARVKPHDFGHKGLFTSPPRE
jgi:hypothetical protein